MNTTSPSRSLDSSAQPLNVLLVDDSIHDYRVISVLVDSQAENQYKFDWAQNCEEATTRLEKGDIDLVAVDYNLGLEFGSDVINELSKKYPDPAYLLVTANQDPKVYKKGIQAGAENFVSKGKDCGTLFDRSAQYALERKRLSKSLKLTNASKDWLMSLLAKDLSTPLFALNDLLSTLMKEGSQMPAEMLKELLETAYNTSCESIVATTEMLEWGQSIEGTMTPKMGMIDVGKCFQRAIRLLTTVADERSVYISQKGTFDVKAYCDERMLSSVTRNLISAGMSYTDDGEDLAISSSIKDNTMTVDIKAKGRHIEADSWNFLQNPSNDSAQLVSAAQRPILNGIQISSHMLGAMGGNLEISNKSDTGVHFSFELPLNLPIGSF